MQPSSSQCGWQRKEIDGRAGLGGVILRGRLVLGSSPDSSKQGPGWPDWGLVTAGAWEECSSGWPPFQPTSLPFSCKFSFIFFFFFCSTLMMNPCLKKVLSTLSLKWKCNRWHILLRISLETNTDWQQCYKTKNIKPLRIPVNFYTSGVSLILSVPNHILAGQGQLEQYRSHWEIAQGETDVLSNPTFYTSKVFGACRETSLI